MDIKDEPFSLSILVRSFVRMFTVDELTQLATYNSCKNALKLIQEMNDNSIDPSIMINIKQEMNKLNIFRIFVCVDSNYKLCTVLPNDNINPDVVYIENECSRTNINSKRCNYYVIIFYSEEKFISITLSIYLKETKLDIDEEIDSNSPIIQLFCMNPILAIYTFCPHLLNSATSNSNIIELSDPENTVSIHNQKEHLL